MVHLGPLELPYRDLHSEVVQEAKVFVRPHDVTIDTKTDGLPSLGATVERIHSAGAMVRLELRSNTGQSLFAEVSQERFLSLQLAVSSDVFIRPRHIRVFAK